MLNGLSFLVLLYVSGYFKKKNPEFFPTRLMEKFRPISLFFFTFYRRPFRTLGVTLGSHISIAAGHRSSMALITYGQVLKRL